MNERREAKEFWTDPVALSELADRTGESGNQLAAVMFTAARFAALGIHPDPEMPAPLPSSKPAKRAKPAKKWALQPAAPVEAAVTAEAATYEETAVAEPTVDSHSEASVKAPAAAPTWLNDEPEIEEEEPVRESKPATADWSEPATMPLISSDRPGLMSKKIEEESERDDASTVKPSEEPNESEDTIHVTHAEVGDADDDDAQRELVGVGFGETSAAKVSPYRRRVGRLLMLMLICVVAWMAHNRIFAPAEQALISTVKTDLLLAPQTPKEESQAKSESPTLPTSEDESVFTITPAESADAGIVAPESTQAGGEWMQDKLFSGNEKTEAKATEPARSPVNDEIIEAVRSAQKKPTISIKPTRQPIAGPAIIEAIRNATSEQQNSELPSTTPSGNDTRTKKDAAGPSSSSAGVAPVKTNSARAEVEEQPMFAEGMADWVGSLYDAVTKPVEPKLTDAGWLSVSSDADVPMVRKLVEKSLHREPGEMATASEEPTP